MHAGIPPYSVNARGRTAAGSDHCRQGVERLNSRCAPSRRELQPLQYLSPGRSRRRRDPDCRAGTFVLLQQVAVLTFKEGGGLFGAGGEVSPTADFLTVAPPARFLPRPKRGIAAGPWSGGGSGRPVGLPRLPHLLIRPGCTGHSHFEAKPGRKEIRRLGKPGVMTPPLPSSCDLLPRMALRTCCRATPI